uniref:Uncharacterized protein n=1 Tax=Anguilla anguilla TaxID=7936 RepID=A0A0E9TK15_ANGAN
MENQSLGFGAVWLETETCRCWRQGPHLHLSLCVIKLRLLMIHAQ